MSIKWLLPLFFLFDVIKYSVYCLHALNLIQLLFLSFLWYLLQLWNWVNYYLNFKMLCTRTGTHQEICFLVFMRGECRGAPPPLVFIYRYGAHPLSPPSTIYNVYTPRAHIPQCAINIFYLSQNCITAVYFLTFKIKVCFLVLNFFISFKIQMFWDGNSCGYRDQCYKVSQ